ncbi:hypothetical protein ACXU4B_09770 [Dyella soli]|uniref:Type II secretion system protein GspG C-terminal domain-containing protein n=1 Tax=Dyella soli TaxID=522319 RepID=A0A4V2NM10_9GAMM|nr:hypothetical protein [Dyella soli]TCI11221.1 hypothetical protein EZM97_20660 [Dyella soli]
MTSRVLVSAVLAVALLLGSGCALKREADAQFGDQNFKTAVALVELYKARHGYYPESLSGLTFIGKWDVLALNSVEYKRVDNGYELDIVRGWVGQPELSYPPDFWRGLGLVSSNVAGAPRRATHP